MPKKPERTPTAQPTYPSAVAEPVIQDTLARKLAKHKGQWVAVDQVAHVVIASGGSAADVFQAAQEQHFADPLVFRVPLHPDRLNLL